jgi:hypothetical protein
MAMRFRSILPAALAALFWAAGLGAAAAQSSQGAYVERRGLLEADAQCGLFDANVRAALQASAGQARGALLAHGWSITQFDELERATVRAARARGCDDPRTVEAANSARAGFAAWARMARMDFPGWERSWSALRIPDSDGWLLQQVIPGPRLVVFGVREHEGAQHLAVRLVLAPGEPEPASMQMLVRDPILARTSLIGVPGRTATGLEAGAPSPATARRFVASGRWLGPRRGGGREITFSFPPEAFEAMMWLDPREAAELRWGDGRDGRRLLVEIGDVAAARAFLAAQGAR